MNDIRAADRHLLGDLGLGLDARTYAEALAGAGGLQRHSYGDPLLSWWPEWNSTDPLASEDLEAFLAKSRSIAQSERRIYLDAADSRWFVDPLAVLRVLTHLRPAGVFLRLRNTRSDLRWQWPMRVAASDEDLQELRLETLRTLWPASTLFSLDSISRERARSEILIIRGSVRSALQRVLSSPFPMRASLLILVGPTDLSWGNTRPALDALLSDLQSGGVSLVSPKSPDAFARAMRGLCYQLSHNEPLDVALQAAFASSDALHVLDFGLIDAVSLPRAMSELSTRIVAMPKAARLDVEELTRSRIDLNWRTGDAPADLADELSARAMEFPYARESEGGSAAAELSASERSARRDFSEEDLVRTVQADLFSIVEGEPRMHARPLRALRQYRLDVFIAPGVVGALNADRAFPDGHLEWGKSDQFHLTVLFAEASQWDEVQRGTVTLPRYGASNRTSFHFQPVKAGPFRARVTAMYRGRVLQTCLLEAIVLAATANEQEQPVPRLVVETRLRESLATLDDRQRFDAAIVFNQAVDGKPTMQVAGEDGAYIASLDDSTESLRKISASLHDAALEARLYGKKLKTKAEAELLVDLATNGHALYRNLVIDYIDESAAAYALRAADHLQIVSAKPDAIVPLELVYEYHPPATGVPVCTNAGKALAEGACPATCIPSASPAPHVCPLGFWGLRKVIERHVHNPKLDTAARINAVEPIVGRDKVHLSGTVLLGASEKVTKVDRRSLAQILKKKWTSGKTTVVTKWKDWPLAIEGNKPVLILALPHSTLTAGNIGLEIGGDVLESRFIVDSYVRAKPDLKPPLVILLGCDAGKAGDIKAYMSHVGYFRQAKAPVIIGTLASVDAKESATCASMLIPHLVNVIGTKPGRLGQVLLETKRQAVASGLIMGLGLAGFGDADWALEP